jgi:hypothetical protein
MRHFGTTSFLKPCDLRFGGGFFFNGLGRRLAETCTEVTMCARASSEVVGGAL